MSTIDRRSLIKAAGGIGLSGLLSRPALAKVALARDAGNSQGGYGPLKAIPSANTGETILHLPEGFQYTVFGRTGDKMTDGIATPSAHDGMAAFQLNGNIRLIRNHEVRDKPSASYAAPEVSYDATAAGGTTTLDIDPKTREVVRHFASLSGTLVNCAGGPTPWGSWISCEETVAGTHEGAVYHLDKTVAKYGKDHGYCFEVSVLNDECKRTDPIKAMGRFVHEALAVDPSTGIVYMTEDTGAAGFYRFIPNVPTQLHKGGRLQMLRVKDRPALDTRKAMKAMQPLTVDWVDIKDPDPANATQNEAAVFEQGIAQGAATFGRLEGAWYGNGLIYIVSTSGGDAGKGQIWRYQPRGESRGELVMLFESPGSEILDMPDNLCVSPRGGLVICEDGDGENHVRGMTGEGTIFDFALNAYNDSEFAGACFSPDGQTLFFNIQRPGLTCAVWGPWDRGTL